MVAVDDFGVAESIDSETIAVMLLLLLLLFVPPPMRPTAGRVGAGR